MMKKFSIAVIALLVFVLAIGSVSATVVTHSVDGYTYSVDVVHIPANANDNNNPSKYVPISTIDRLGDGCGSIYVSTLAHVATFSDEFTIQRMDAGKINFTSGGFVSPQLVALMTPIGNATSETLAASGLWDDRVAPGVYLLKLKDGNGGQPEMIMVRVAAGSIEHVNFIGHAVTEYPGDPKAAIVTPDPCPGISIDSVKLVQTGTKSITTVTYPNMEDVTTYFRAQTNAIKTGQTNDWAWLNSFESFYGSSFYDPAVGTEKSIIVKYRNNGVETTTTDSNVNAHPLNFFNTIPKHATIISAFYGDPSKINSITTTIPVYGVEVNIDIDSETVSIKNPNRLPVDVGFTIDVHYAKDVSNGGPVDIQMVKETFYGFVPKVTGNHYKWTGTFTNLDAVGSLNLHVYPPYIDNVKVISTTWDF